jgi:hypothetical protein
MKFGRFGGQIPLRLGGGESLSLKLYRDLNAKLGTAYDTTEDSTVTAETAAEARILAAAWHANERAANQLDPDRMTDFVGRWETFLDLSRSDSDTIAIRRARIKAKLGAVGSPTRDAVSTICESALGSAFVGLEAVDLDSAIQRWPGNGYSTDHYSTTAHLTVRTVRPSGMANGAFLSTCSALTRILRDFIPDYATATWATLNSGGSNGFLLDDSNNLDAETFDA